MGVDAVVDATRQLEIGPVQYVEALRTELQAGSLGDLERLKQRNVRIEEIGTHELVAPFVADANHGFKVVTVTWPVEEGVGLGPDHA